MLRISLTDIIWEKYTVKLDMIIVGVILHKLRIKEMDTKLGGTEMEVEFHDDDDGL